MNQDPPDNFALADALISASRLLKPLVDAFDGQDSTTLQIEAHAKLHSCSLFEAAEHLDLEVPVGLAAVALTALIYKWFEHGAQTAIHVHDWIDLHGTAGDQRDNELLAHLAKAGEALAQWHLEHDFPLEELLGDAANALASAARIAEESGHIEDALAARLSCTNLIGRFADRRSLEAFDHAARLGRLLDHVETGVFEVLRANCAVRMAQAGRLTWQRASRAVERAARALPQQQEALEKAFSVLWHLMKDNASVQSSTIWVQFVIRQVDAPPELLALTDGMESWLAVRSERTIAGMASRILQIGKLVGLLEDLNAALESPPTDHTVVADWVSWAFRHSAFRRAVISGESLLRERDLNGILLVMNHELTHMYSMGSGIGAMVSALSAAMLEREVDLYRVAVAEAGEADEDDLKGETQMPSLAKLEQHALALGKAEQVLELTLKLMAVKEVWEPWFEGIAVFTETGADPSDDPVAHAGPVPVIMNMVDRPVSGGATTLADTTERVKEIFTEAEALYGRALRAEGRPRLMAYCVRHRSLYLSGILAVRAVVAAWRSRLGRPVSGAQCARILLDYTRSATYEVIADLSLPLELFRARLISGMERFYRQAVEISADDLELALENPEKLIREGRDFSWLGGRAQRVSQTIEVREAALYEQLQEMAGQAQRSLTGELASIARASDADVDCVAVMRAVADTLAEGRPKEGVMRAQIDSGLRLLSVLPLGDVEAPFWLVPEEHGVLVAFRTTECHKDTGESSYNAEFYGLGSDLYAKLEEEYLRLGEPRLRVLRVADLVPGAYGGDRGRGRNYSVLHYGGWLHVQSKGIAPHSSEPAETLVSDIRERVIGNPLTRFGHTVLGDGRHGAQRTLDWLRDTPGWTVAGRPVNLEPWAARVRDLAAQVLDPARRVQRGAASLRLLELAFGDEKLAAQVEAQGLEALRVEPGASVSDAVRLLFESARQPSSQSAAESIGRAWSLFEQRDWGWDVKPPLIQPAAVSVQ